MRNTGTQVFLYLFSFVRTSQGKVPKFLRSVIFFFIAVARGEAPSGFLPFIFCVFLFAKFKLWVLLSSQRTQSIPPVFSSHEMWLLVTDCKLVTAKLTMTYMWSKKYKKLKYSEDAIVYPEVRGLSTRDVKMTFNGLIMWCPFVCVNIYSQ